jgi:hypothetical protein
MLPRGDVLLSGRSSPQSQSRTSNRFTIDMDEHEQIPIWFFIGNLLLVYGIIIAGEGLYYLFAQHANKDLALQWLHADLWWGIILIALGSFYTIHYFPWRKQN